MGTRGTPGLWGTWGRGAWGIWETGAMGIWGGKGEMSVGGFGGYAVYRTVGDPMRVWGTQWGRGDVGGHWGMKGDVAVGWEMVQVSGRGDSDEDSDRDGR